MIDSPASMAWQMTPSILRLPVRERLPRTVFYVLLSAVVVVAQVAFCYFESLFQLHNVPPHDMYQGAPLFATNMHSMRLSGDLAWWNPISNNGYAQYYQTFLSPLTPTCGHIVFIIWAQAIRLLALMHLAVPEYYQYLTVNYIVLPFLMYFAFAALLGTLFLSRCAITLVIVVYAFSGIGLWNMAWFFAQEPFTFFFVLATAFSLLKKPTTSGFCWFLAAFLIQFASANYWTVYNSWFYAIVLGAYALTYPHRLKRFFHWLRLELRHPTQRQLIAVGVTASVCLLWALLLSSVYAQSHFYERTWDKPYSDVDAFGRAQEMREYILELFDPSTQNALRLVQINQVHNFRYLGASLVPLLAILPFYQWRRTERFLLLSSVATLAVCIAPPFMLWLWNVTPGMNGIVHTFSFYTQYWQLLVAMMAGAALDRIVVGVMPPVLVRRLRSVLIFVVGIAALLLVGFGAVSWRFPVADPALQANVRLGTIVFISAVIMLQVVDSSRRSNTRLLVGAFALLLVTDLANYFWEGVRIDNEFTASRWGGVPTPLPSQVAAPLARPWAAPDFSRGGIGAGIFENMPVRNDFWPVNGYIGSRDYRDFFRTEKVASVLSVWAPLAFFQNIDSAHSLSEASELLQRDPARFSGKLVLQQPPQAVPPPGLPGKPGEPEFRFAWKQWRYNSQRFSIEAPSDGWLFVSQLPDPSWHISVDGRETPFTKANFVGMGVPVHAGHHDVAMAYWPLARKLYWPASILLEATLIALVASGMRLRTRRAEFSTRSRPSRASHPSAPA